VMDVTADTRTQPASPHCGHSHLLRAGHCELPCGGLPPPPPTVDRNEGGLQPKSHGTEALNLPTTLQ